MPNLRLCSTLFLATILAGCQQASGSGAPAEGAVATAAPASAAPAAPAPTRTAVGARVDELRGEVQRLDGNIDQHLATLAQIRQERDATAGQYYAAVGEISTRLQAGTTPSNPLMLAKWAEARGLLDKLEGNLSHVSALANDMAIDGQTGAYLDDSTRAVFAMPGALDEDHAQLRELDAEVGASQAKLSGEMTAVTNEINRQNASLGVERNNIATLAEGVRAGQFVGRSLANPPVRVAAAKAPQAKAAATHGKLHRGDKAKPAAPAETASAAPASDAPSLPAKPADKRSAKPAHSAAVSRDAHGALMVIRLDGYHERYEEALYSAVSRTLQAQPNAKFRVTGISPEGASSDETAARLGDVRRRVEDVQRSLLAFGLDPARVSTASTTNRRAPVEEIRVYKQ
ncbi:hypothetical protein GCM10011611_06380 [Aliidongia dinghuensis]|uniref:OmpA-like domain-containing protein n=1 Tax=Aliidongia dinghuensis TaxID=1867774 RepID=A0A8J2YPA5_9PROT|nr:hypothetical protein [Aliidongia dinghuensis]GGF03638.1 hypothetical protein GCM10011611_06380 [Aliidongia dinghuensis]